MIVVDKKELFFCLCLYLSLSVCLSLYILRTTKFLHKHTYVYIFMLSRLMLYTHTYHTENAHQKEAKQMLFSSNISSMKIYDVAILCGINHFCKNKQHIGKRVVCVRLSIRKFLSSNGSSALVSIYFFDISSC